MLPDPSALLARCKRVSHPAVDCPTFDLVTTAEAPPDETEGTAAEQLKRGACTSLVERSRARDSDWNGRCGAKIERAVRVLLEFVPDACGHERDHEHALRHRPGITDLQG